jgi:hypothetical protein
MLKVREQLALETRRKRQIENQIDREPSVEGFKAAVIDFRRKHTAAIHRPTGPCKTYNCHGLTFAARRSWIGSPEVGRILKDDDYEKVSDVMPGDVALYVQDGDFSHSGIVVMVRMSVPWILSKWGECHEVVHAVMDCPYSKSTVSYYRVGI